jgi:hypothetical protein
LVDCLHLYCIQYSRGKKDKMPQEAGVVQKGAGTAGGAVFAVIFVWVLELNGIIVPPDVAIAFGGAFTIAGNFIVRRLS